jgi:branched-chain amino acid transport system permease protein
MQFFGNIIVLASIYGLLAMGFVIIYRASRVINFAHGELMMLGGYFLFSVLSITGFHGIAGTIIGMFFVLMISFIVSLLIYRLLIHPMLGQPVFIIVMVTIGLSFILRGLTIFVWGAEPKSLITSMGIGNHPHSLGKVSFSTFDLLLVIAFFFLLTGLGIFLKYLRVGVRSRTASENPLLASQRGINIYFLFALSWGIATMLTFVAGILYSANVHLAPEIGFLGLKAMPVALVGGMYSLLGVIPGAIIISLAENLVAQYYDPLVADVIPMLILLIVLIVKPWGIFGKEEEVERV